jgi:hypothetical protein
MYNKGAKILQGPICNIIINKKELTMKMMVVLLLSMFALGCAEKNDEVFSLEEANKCLFDSDKKAVLEAVVWIKKADVAKDEKEAVEYFEKAYEPIQELYSASRDDDSITGRKRSAALAWVLIDFSYNHATGSCAKWVLFAQRLGLEEADQIVADPPEKLRNYLLPPERQAPARR